MIKAIETTYAGCRFRSRLEARWAVFFDTAGIPWEYEPQGFVIDGRPYLPDFRLPECGTWIEVKGTIDEEEVEFLRAASEQLPSDSTEGEKGPPLMLVGPIPELRYGVGAGGKAPYLDFGWYAFGAAYGFGTYYKNRRPWFLCSAESTPFGKLPNPSLDGSETMYSEIATAYTTARRARFEHGERP